MPDTGEKREIARSVSPSNDEKPRETEDDHVQAGSERMVDEGSPIHTHG
jgi:hypothetical protein